MEWKSVCLVYPAQTTVPKCKKEHIIAQKIWLLWSIDKTVESKETKYASKYHLDFEYHHTHVNQWSCEVTTICLMFITMSVWWKFQIYATYNKDTVPKLSETLNMSHALTCLLKVKLSSLVWFASEAVIGSCTYTPIPFDNTVLVHVVKFHRHILSITKFILMYLHQQWLHKVLSLLIAGTTYLTVCMCASVDV